MCGKGIKVGRQMDGLVEYAVDLVKMANGRKGEVGKMKKSHGVRRI